MKAILATLLVVIFCLPLASLALPCSTIENGTSLGAERDQDGIGWCYAFAASEVVSRRLGRRVSAVDIASSYVKDAVDHQNPLIRMHQIFRDSSLPVESGDIAQAILATQNLKQGFCDETEIPSGPELRLKLKSLSIVRACHSTTSETCSLAWSAAHALFPRLSTEQIYSEVADGVSVEVWDRLTRRACGTRTRLARGTSVVRVTSSNDQSRHEMLDRVDQRLQSGDVVGLEYNPVSFYSSAWWAQPDDSFVSLVGETMRVLGQAEISTHAVAIVGRRFNTSKQTCEYEIRDSNSPRCHGTKSEYCDANARIWYPRADLALHARSIVYLKAP